MQYSLIAPVKTKIVNMNNVPIPETFCTHVVNCYRGNTCVDAIPFNYDGMDVVNYALDILSQQGKISDRIEITTL